MLLTAESIPIAFNGGMVMPGWYDFKSIDCSSEESMKFVNLETLDSSVKRIKYRFLFLGVLFAVEKIIFIYLLLKSLTALKI